MAERRLLDLNQIEQPTPYVRLPESCKLRLNVVPSIVFLEAHVHQLIDQRAGRVPKGRLGHVSVGFVQFGGLTPFGVGHPQHPAEELFYVLCTLDA